MKLDLNKLSKKKQASWIWKRKISPKKRICKTCRLGTRGNPNSICS